MSSSIEVIPAIPLEWRTLIEIADEPSAPFLVDSFGNKASNLDDMLDAYIYGVYFRGKSFVLHKRDSRDHFIVHDPIEYL